MVVRAEKHWWLGWALLSLAGCGGASKPPLRVAYGVAPPIIALDKDHQPVGFAVDLLREAARRQRIPIVWKPGGTRVGNEEAMADGTLDLILTGYPTAERRARFYVSDPWWSTEMILLTPESSGIRTTDDLAGRKLAISEGPLRVLLPLAKGTIPVPMNSAAEGANLACKGQVDGTLVANLFLRDILTDGLSQCRGVPLRAIDTHWQWEYCLVGRRERAADIQALRDEFEEMTVDGTMAELASRYPAIASRYTARMAAAIRNRFLVRIEGILLLAGLVVLVLAGVAIYRMSLSRRQLRASNLQLAEDLERRVRAEAALRESEARFRSLFECAPQAIIAYDDAGHVRFANPPAAALFGRDPAGANYSELFTDGGRNAVRRPDGQTIPVEVSSASFQEAGTPLTLAFLADISQRLSLETQLRQSQKLESIGRLAGGVAHDFNNLLTVIIGNVEMARMMEGDSAAPYLEQIGRASQRASSLTRQLLSFARRSPVQPVRLNVNDVLREVSQMLGRLIGEDIALEMILEASDPVVLADPGEFEQIVVNLAINARDAMPNGGRLAIRTADFHVAPGPAQEAAGLAPGGSVLLSVSDTGQGMTPEVRSRVFEPFFTTKEVGKGTGLGLATVYGIVKQCGGSISVYSEPGQGTSFKLLFPLAGGAANNGAATGLTAPMRGGSETILVAEDDDAVRTYVCGLLRLHGYQVRESASADEALAAAQSMDLPHLLLTDVVMPGCSGVDLRDRFHALHPHVPVLFMSGYSAELRTQTDGTPYLEKPFTPAVLLARVRAILDA